MIFEEKALLFKKHEELQKKSFVYYCARRVCNKRFRKMVTRKDYFMGREYYCQSCVQRLKGLLSWADRLRR